MPLTDRTCLDLSLAEVVLIEETTQGLEDQTLVIFTSDNGPWLSYGDHAGSAQGLREGKGTAFEGGGREPFFVFADDLSIAESKSSPCSFCHGKGALRVVCEDVPIYDAFCRGTGHHLYSDGSLSDWPDPKGQKRKAGPVYRCDHCHGVGVRSLTGKPTIKS